MISHRAIVSDGPWEYMQIVQKHIQRGQNAPGNCALCGDWWMLLILSNLIEAGHRVRVAALLLAPASSKYGA
jgi:hypothetical protein